MYNVYKSITLGGNSMLKKVLSLILALTMLLSLVACTSAPAESTAPATTDGEAESAGEEAAEEKEPVHLIFNLGAPHDEDPAAQQAMEDVMAQDKYSHVTWESVPYDVSYNETMPITIAGGQQIDILDASSGINRSLWAEEGLFYPLDEIAAEMGFDFEEHYGDYIYSVNSGDEINVIPITATTWGIAYNKKIFDDAGIEYPSAFEPMTWDEYDELALALTSGEGGDKIYGTLEVNWEMYWMSEAIIGLGGADKFFTEDGLSNIEDPLIAESMEGRYNRMFVDESAPTYADIQTSNTQVQAFLNGNYGMLPAGDWVMNWSMDLEQYPRDWDIGICPLPNDDAENVKTWGDIRGMAVGATSVDPALAFEIMVEYQARIKEISDRPRIENTVEAENVFAQAIAFWEEDSGITEEEFLAVFANPDIEIVAEKVLGPGSIEYNKIMNEEVGLYYVQEQDLETTISNIKTRADEYLSTLQ